MSQLVINMLQMTAFIFHYSLFQFPLVTHIPLRCWNSVENALSYTSTSQSNFKFMVFLSFAETASIVDQATTEICSSKRFEKLPPIL